MYGDTDYQVGQAGGRLLVLNESYLFIYDTEGTMLSSRQHAYGSAMLRTQGEYALVYEYGKVYLNVPGCTFSSLYGFSSGSTLEL